MSPTYGNGLFNAITPLTTGIAASFQFVFTPTPATANGTILQPAADVAFGPTVPSPAPSTVSFVWGTSAAVPPTTGNAGGSLTGWGIGYTTDTAVASYGGGDYIRIGAPLGGTGGAKPPSGSYYGWVFVKMADGTFYTYVGTPVVAP